MALRMPTKSLRSRQRGGDGSDSTGKTIFACSGGPQVTKRGMAELKKALPKCQIYGPYFPDVEGFRTSFRIATILRF